MVKKKEPPEPEEDEEEAAEEGPEPAEEAGGETTPTFVPVESEPAAGEKPEPAGVDVAPHAGEPPPVPIAVPILPEPEAEPASTMVEEAGEQLKEAITTPGEQ